MTADNDNPALKAWEELFRRSVARELDRAESDVSGAWLSEAVSFSMSSSGLMTVRGDVEWTGGWDVSPALAASAVRDGASIVVAAARDLDDRVEALMMETAHAMALRGRTLRLVAIGEPRRGSRAVQHALSAIEADGLLRLGSAMTAVLRVEGSEEQLSRLAARFGRECIGIGPGASGDRCIGSFSSIELADALDLARRTEPLDEPFAPDLLDALRERARA